MNQCHLSLLAETSRTFFLPIVQAPPRLRNAVGSAYLCMRAIDEIEDHAVLSAPRKVELLTGIADGFDAAQEGRPLADMNLILASGREQLPEVSLRLAETAAIAAPEARLLIWRYTGDMARAMAGWVNAGWRIRDEPDLDQYTFDVAGRVGLLLSRLWRWYDGTVCDDDLAVGFGRALQAVNIVRNREEDRKRGVDFFPEGWDRTAMIRYVRRQIRLADAYMEPLLPGPVRDFCLLPLELAKATLRVIEAGREKMNRKEVMALVAQLGIK